MNGISKGLCSFGRVTPHKMGRCPKDRGDVPVRSETASLVGLGKAQISKALRKGESRKQSSELFSGEGRLASEGVPYLNCILIISSNTKNSNTRSKKAVLPAIDKGKDMIYDKENVTLMHTLLNVIIESTFSMEHFQKGGDL